MKEQSHKAEMSAALRGDFQRLRARGVDAALVPQDDRGPDEEPTAEPPAEPSAVPTPEELEDEPPARRGWLSRFAGR